MLAKRLQVYNLFTLSGSFKVLYVGPNVRSRESYNPYPIQELTFLIFLLFISANC